MTLPSNAAAFAHDLVDVHRALLQLYADNRHYVVLLQKASGPGNHSVDMRQHRGLQGWPDALPRLVAGRALAANGVVSVAASRSEIVAGSTSRTISAVFYGGLGERPSSFVATWLAGCRATEQAGRPSVALLPQGVLSVRVTTQSGVVDGSAIDRLLSVLRERLQREFG